MKALTNFAAGRLGDRIGRKRVLVAGWLFALPVPFLIMWAPTWSWIVFANVLLGVNQGLAWSTTVIMKIDLVGPQRRGFAMGLNEFAGYLAVALTALATGYIAGRYGLRPAPFYLGAAVAMAGLLLSSIAVRETASHAALEADRHRNSGETGPSPNADSAPTMWEILARASWRDPALFGASQAGLVNNLNDGLAWGLFPLFFAAAGLSVRDIGVLASVYPATWRDMGYAVGALLAGTLADAFGMRTAIGVIAALTMASGLLVVARMPETKPVRQSCS